VNKLVYHQQPNLENIAAQALGTQFGTMAGEEISKELETERIKLRIFTQAEIMAMKRQEEEKAVWRQENSEQKQESQEQQQSTARMVRMMQAKQQVAEVSLSIGGLNTGDSNTISNDLYADWRSEAQAEAKPVSNANSNKQPFLSNPTSTGDSNGKWQQNVNAQNQQSASASILSAINAQTSAAGAGGYNQFENADWFEKTVVFGAEAAVGAAIGSALGVDAAIGWGVGAAARGIAGGLERFGVFGSKEVSNSIEASVNRALDDVKAAQEKYSANNANAADALQRKYSALGGAQNNAVKTRVLSDGRIQYYNPEIPSATSGVTRGASYVTEYNPKTGEVSSWIEAYDYSGTVTRIHPKMFNGQTLESLHFPPTNKELLQYSMYEESEKITNFRIR
jgi:hypothetical protein